MSAATAAFAAAIAEAEELVRNASFVETEQDLREGLDYLSGSIQASLRLAWTYDPERPAFINSTSQHLKMGLDNPDTVYHHANLRPDATYVISGSRGTSTDLSFQILAGDYTPTQAPDGSTAFDDRALDVAPDGTFSFRMGPGPADGKDYIVRGPRGLRRLGHRAARQLHHRAPRRTRPGGAEGPGPPLRDGRQDADLPDQDLVRLPGVVLPQGAGEHPDRAAGDPWRADLPVVLGRPLRPRRGRGDDPDRPAWGRAVPGFQLGSMWYTSLDYLDHQTSLNGHQARIDDDGMIRIVVSERNPGLANWVERLGHRRGYLQFRWQRLDGELTAADGPTLEIVPFDELPKRLPHYDEAQVTPEEWAERIAARRAGVAWRMIG
jgi:hypothetical protein